MNSVFYVRKKFADLRPPSEDINWIDMNRIKLASKYYGEYIAVLGKKVVAHGPVYVDLLTELEKRLDRRDYNLVTIEMMIDRKFLVNF